MHQSHISFVMYGLSDRRWVAYAFDKNTFDDKDLEDDIYPYEKFQEDPIAKVDADLPIWDPREYFLLIFKTRMYQVLKEWRNLIRGLERSIEGYVCRYSCLHKESCTANDSVREFNILVVYHKNSEREE